MTDIFLSFLGISVSVSLIVAALVVLAPVFKICHKMEISDLDISCNAVACSFQRSGRRRGYGDAASDERAGDA